MGGQLTITGAGTITTLTGTGGEVRINEGTVTNIRGHGARIDYRSPNTVADTIMYGGSLDASRDPRAKTFTTVETHEGAKVNFNNGPGNIVVTNPIKQIGGDVKANNATFSPV